MEVGIYADANLLLPHVSVTAFMSDSTSKPAPRKQGYRRCQPPSLNVVLSLHFPVTLNLDSLFAERIDGSKTVSKAGGNNAKGRLEMNDSIQTASNKLSLASSNRRTEKEETKTTYQLVDQAENKSDFSILFQLEAFPRGLAKFSETGNGGSQNACCCLRENGSVVTGRISVQYGKFELEVTVSEDFKAAESFQIM